MNLDGIAGRQLLGRLGVTRQERKRAADNDNVGPPEVARGGVALGKGSGGFHSATTAAQDQKTDRPPNA
jgi:hypothetical protein